MNFLKKKSKYGDRVQFSSSVEAEYSGSSITHSNSPYFLSHSDTPSNNGKLNISPSKSMIKPRELAMSNSAKPGTVRMRPPGASIIRQPHNELPFLQDIKKKKDKKKEIKRFKKLVEENPTFFATATFTIDELKWLWSDWVSSAPQLMEEKSKGMKMEEWIHSLNHLAVNNPLLQDIFRVVDSNKDGLIDFMEYITVLSDYTRGNLDRKLEFMFKLFDSNLDQRVSSVDVKLSVSLINDLLHSVAKDLTKEDFEMMNAKAICDHIFSGYDGEFIDLKNFKKKSLSDGNFISTMDRFFEYVFEVIIRDMEYQIPDEVSFKHKIFKRDLHYILKREKSLTTLDIPLIVQTLIEYLCCHPDILKTEGFFRLSCNSTQLSTIKARFDMGKYVDLQNCSPAVIGDVIKSFFRELPEPLICFVFYDDFMDVAKEIESSVGTIPLPLSTSVIVSRKQSVFGQLPTISTSLPNTPRDSETPAGEIDAKQMIELSENIEIYSSARTSHRSSLNSEERVISRLQFLLSGLPKENQKILYYLLHFLNKVVKEEKSNKMDVYNLSTIYAPLLLVRKGENDPLRMMAESKYCIWVVEILIRCFEKVFKDILDPQERVESGSIKYENIPQSYLHDPLDDEHYMYNDDPSSETNVDGSLEKEAELFDSDQFLLESKEMFSIVLTKFYTELKSKETEVSSCKKENKWLREQWMIEKNKNSRMVQVLKEKQYEKDDEFKNWKVIQQQNEVLRNSVKSLQSILEGAAGPQGVSVVKGLTQEVERLRAEIEKKNSLPDKREEETSGWVSSVSSTKSGPDGKIPITPRFKMDAETNNETNKFMDGVLNSSDETGVQMERPKVPLLNLKQDSNSSDEKNTGELVFVVKKSARKVPATSPVPGRKSTVVKDEKSHERRKKKEKKESLGGRETDKEKRYRDKEKDKYRDRRNQKKKEAEKKDAEKKEAEKKERDRSASDSSDPGTPDIFHPPPGMTATEYVRTELERRQKELASLKKAKRRQGKEKEKEKKDSPTGGGSTSRSKRHTASPKFDPFEYRSMMERRSKEGSETDRKKYRDEHRDDIDTLRSSMKKDTAVEMLKRREYAKNRSQSSADVKRSPDPTRLGLPKET